MVSPENLSSSIHPLGDGRNDIIPAEGDNSVDNLLRDALVIVQANQKARKEHPNLKKPLDEVTFQSEYNSVAKNGPQTPWIESSGIQTPVMANGQSRPSEA